MKEIYLILVLLLIYTLPVFIMYKYTKLFSNKKHLLIANTALIFYLVVWSMMIFYARIINSSNVLDNDLLVGIYLALSFSLIPIFIIVVFLDLQWLMKRLFGK